MAPLFTEASGEHERAVGWLHPDHPYLRGDVSPAFLSRLKEFVALSDDSADALGFGASRDSTRASFARKHTVPRISECRLVICYS